MPETIPTTIDTAQVRSLVHHNPRARLIDVRNPAEFTATHIPGSCNVPLEVLRAQQGMLTAEHDDPIVLVCGSGMRAESARALLHEAGLRQLHVLRGGVTAWQQHDAPVNTGSGPWAMERQVRLTAGLLVLTGVLGSTVYRPLKWLAGFVGGGLTFAGLSDTCAMSRLLALLPHNRAGGGDPAATLTAITGPAPAGRPEHE